MKLVLKYAWVGAIVFGFVLAGAGLFMVNEGRAAYSEVRDTLAAERIVTAEDAAVPLAPVTGPAEAKAQAEIIREHVLRTTGGKTYAELDRSDPNRTLYLNSVTLRTALMQSYMAFKIADLVQGVGVLVALLGLSHVVLGLYLGVILPRLRESQAEAGGGARGRLVAQPAKR